MDVGNVEIPNIFPVECPNSKQTLRRKLSLFQIIAAIVSIKAQIIYYYYYSLLSSSHPFHKGKIFSLDNNVYIWRRIGFLYPEFSGRDYSNKKRKRREERLIFHGGGKSFRQTYSYTSNVSYQCRGYSYRILVAVIAACQLEHARFIRKYIYIYQSRKYHVLVPRDGERDRENLGGEECILVIGKSIVCTYIIYEGTRFPAMVINPWALVLLSLQPNPSP